VAAQAQTVADLQGRPVPTQVGDVWPNSPYPTLPLPTDPDELYIFLPSQIRKPGKVSPGQPATTPVSDPCYVAERAKDIEDGSQSVTVAYSPEPGQWATIPVPPSDLETPTKISKVLRDLGLGIKKPKDLASYLGISLATLKLVSPPTLTCKAGGIVTHDGHPKLALPAATWGPTGLPPSDLVRYQAEYEYPPLHAARPLVGSQADAIGVWQHLWQIGDPQKIALVFGWAAATMWTPLIREAMNRQFPILHLWGRHGSGKTTDMQIILTALWGGTAQNYAVDKEFGLLRMMSQSATVPVWVDEYRLGRIKPARLADIHSLLRRNFDQSWVHRNVVRLRIRRTFVPAKILFF